MTVTIRAATGTDLPAVLALYAQPEIDDGAVLPLAEAERIFARFAAYPDYRLFVAVDGQAVVGSFALLVMDNLGHLGARSAVVEDVVVDPARQGGGIGRAMMAHALAEARGKGCYTPAPSSALKRDAAHAFYAGLGFDRHGYSFLVATGDAA